MKQNVAVDRVERKVADMRQVYWNHRKLKRISKLVLREIDAETWQIDEVIGVMKSGETCAVKLPMSTLPNTRNFKALWGTLYAHADEDRVYLNRLITSESFEKHRL